MKHAIRLSLARIESLKTKLRDIKLKLKSEKQALEDMRRFCTHGDRIKILHDDGEDSFVLMQCVDCGLQALPGGIL